MIPLFYLCYYNKRGPFCADPNPRLSARGQKKWVKVIGTLLVWILAVLGAGVLVLCCLAAWDYWKTGDAETAVSLGITAVILAVAIYVLLRSYFKKT